MEKEVKKRKEELELQVAQSMKHYNTVFDIATNCAISIFNASYDVVSLFNETKTEYVTGKVTDEHVISRNKQILQKWSEFYEQLHEIIYKNNRFLDIIHIYSACIVSSKEYSINEHTLNMWTKLSKVLESLTIFSELKPLIAKASESETPQLNKSITELISFIAWGMSKISHDFMICTANIQKNNLHKTMTSKLMSAGPDKKLQEKFTENTQKEIMMINQFVGDLSPISENKNDGDTILEAILPSGNNPNIDLLIGYLNWSFQQKHPEDAPSTDDEILVVRIVFSCLIKMNDLLFDIEGLSDEVNLITKFGQFSSETEKYSKINSDLENNKIDQILRCWRLSAKILEWYKSQVSKFCK